jgi:hypothetical protein
MMELQAYFQNIQTVIIDNLAKAEHEILVAVAWFTDREIFNVLCGKAKAGVSVSIALLGDEINQAPSGLDFERLESLGAKVFFLPAGSDRNPMMHHKFCVIDGITVITGSYNWSRKAQTNDENITVVTDVLDFSKQYRQAFFHLSSQLTENIETHPANSNTVRRRLELIRNLILLGEYESLSLHIQKLKLSSESLKIQGLLTFLEQMKYHNALEEITDYLQGSTELILKEDADIGKFQFSLQVLELRLLSLNNEKSDLERCLIVFNRRYNDALGDLVVEVLAAQARTSRIQAELDQANEEDADEAEKNWRDYQDEYEKEKHSAAPIQLQEKQEKELKKLYRKACTLCHPDRFSEEMKEAAHKKFVILQEIYKSNDLHTLKEFYSTLKEGGLPNAPRSSTLSRSEALRAAITELLHKVSDITKQLQYLYQSEEVKMLRSAGITEAEWAVFFENQKQHLEKRLDELRSTDAQYQSE